jgi:metal-dependent hydrolase (beta-lactamase superfamily II)
LNFKGLKREKQRVEFNHLPYEGGNCLSLLYCFSSSRILIDTGYPKNLFNAPKIEGKITLNIE